MPSWVEYLSASHWLPTTPADRLPEFWLRSNQPAVPAQLPHQSFLSSVAAEVTNWPRVNVTV